MTIPATLQRRPFLAPIGLVFTTMMGSALVFVIAAWLLVSSESTTFVVIRHAEKSLDGSADPGLTEAGQSRAALLARMFGDKRLKDHIDAIYVSPPQRNRLTAAPLAASLGITPQIDSQDDPRRLARRMLREHRGQRVLVIGHVDTVPAIVEALSGAKDIAPIGDLEYGTLYIVTVPRVGRAAVLSATY